MISVLLGCLSIVLGLLYCRERSNRSHSDGLLIGHTIRVNNLEDEIRCMEESMIALKQVNRDLMTEMKDLKQRSNAISITSEPLKDVPIDSRTISFLSKLRAKNMRFINEEQNATQMDVDMDIETPTISKQKVPGFHFWDAEIIKKYDDSLVSLSGEGLTRTVGHEKFVEMQEGQRVLCQINISSDSTIKLLRVWEAVVPQAL